MAGLVLNYSISLMLFQEKIYELVHDILLLFLYSVLNYFIKLIVLQGRKLWRISLFVIITTHIFNRIKLENSI